MTYIHSCHGNDYLVCTYCHVDIYLLGDSLVLHSHFHGDFHNDLCFGSQGHDDFHDNCPGHRLDKELPQEGW